MNLVSRLLSATALIGAASTANATELEVTHWWTSGGEAAAVSEFARLFNDTGNTWIDGAIAGSGSTARPIIISRILGGDPMGATQLNHGRQAEELIEAGLMTDLTSLYEENGFLDVIHPKSLVDSCTLDGKIYCIPVNIHSWQWMWLSNKVYEDRGLAVPQDWDAFVESAPTLAADGIIPLAMGQVGWQQNGAFNVMAVAIAGIDAWKKVFVEKDAETVMGPEYTKVFQAAANAREFAKDSNVQDWNLATNLVITDKAGAQIMGDWAQGEFAVAGEVAGVDYTCLPGLGENEILDTAGDAFYFPVNDDPDVQAAQLELAKLLLSKEAQVAFNLKKGSLPVRGDVDLSAANDCMKKGLQLLADGKIMPSGDQAMTPDTTTQLEDLMSEFWASDMSAEEVQQQYHDIIAAAE
ncbi:MAG: carbohydrate ABC transporter substrate-binding protein [Maritimibacter sp.]|nr:carbohydrate ABC transporter substrate-binding protein [Maritimibacter sp.]